MTQPIRIRQGTVADCPAVLKLMQQAFAEYKDWLVPESGVFRETVETLTVRLAHYTLILATVDDSSKEKLVGSIFCTVQNNHEMYFSRLAVLPQYRRQNVGRRLISEVEALAQQHKCASVTLGVRIILKTNVAFFQALGFCEISRHSHTGFDEPTYITMAKLIDAK